MRDQETEQGLGKADIRGTVSPGSLGFGLIGKHSIRHFVRSGMGLASLGFSRAVR